tara:strand:+ start:106 stop:630 length:525 start_codon:yes stop_codon:yes gene_type:complete
MLDTEKYMNTMNLDQEDINKYGLKLGDICHIGGSWATANGYNYCGYKEFKVPLGARAKIIGIKQTNLNGVYGNDAKGNNRLSAGDVYVDFELVDHANPDGTPIRCGNRLAGSFAETSPDFALCPDGTGEPGYLRSPGMRNEGLWESIEGVRIDDSPDGYMQWRPKKLIDPKQYV